MDEFTITTKVELLEFLQLQMKMLYSKIWVKILTAIALLFALSLLVSLLFHWNYVLDSDIYPYGIFLLTMALYLPMLIYFICRINYKRNMRLRESVSYHFSEHTVTSKGESFSAVYTWDKLYKVQTFNGWLLLYHGHMGANFIKFENDDLIRIQELKKYLQAQNYKVKIKM